MLQKYLNVNCLFDSLHKKLLGQTYLDFLWKRSIINTIPYFGEGTVD